jgi:PAS domain S-box-containing protein
LTQEVKDRPAPRAPRIVVAAALTALVPGLLAIVGWLIHVSDFTRLSPAMPAMQFNAALGLVFCSLGLLAVVTNRRRGALAAGALLLILGVATIAEYAARVDLGIDNLLFRHPTNPDITWPGRMGPITALAFVLVGLALLRLTRRPAASAAVALMAAAVVAGAVIALAGLLFRLPPAPGWSRFAVLSIAPQTAIALAALGVGLFARAWADWQIERPGIPPWAPITVGATLATIAAILALAFYARDNALLRRETASKAGNVRDDIEAEIRGRVQALERAARRWAIARPTREQWEAEAKLYVRDFGGFQAIGWADPSLTIRWIVPREGNEGAEGLRLDTLGGRAAAFEEARQRHATATTSPIDLIQGGRGFIVFVPVYRGDNFDGCLAAVFRIRAVLDAILGQHPTGDCGLSAEWGGEMVYSRPGPPDRSQQERSESTEVHLPGAAWTLRVWPEDSLIAARRSLLPHVTLAAGVLVAGLVAATLGLAIAARRRASAVEVANGALTAEMGEHALAERRLRAQLAATDVLSSAATPDEAIRNLLPAIGANLNWDRGEFWALDRASDVLRCCAVWQAEAGAFAAFGAVTDHLALPVSAVLAGKAWGSAGPVWVPDVAADPEFLRRDAAAASGLHAAFSFPLSGGDVAGTMSFFSRHVLPADSRLLHVLGAIAVQAGEFFRHRRAEDALRESEEQARFIADAIPHLVWSSDAAGRQLGANSYWHEYTGQPAGEIQALGWAASLHPDDRARAVTAWEEALTTGNDYRVECRMRRAADGEYRWHLLQSRPVRDAAGRISRWVGTGTDVHDRKEAELVMQRAREAAETASKAKSEFVANMSHEVRTPLHGVIGMTRLALETELTRDQRDYLESARDSAEALLGIVDDVLDFSKIEAGKLELHVERFPLRGALDELLKPLAVRAAEKGVRLSCHVADRVPNDLVGDIGRLRQVLINLVGNAVKFTQHGEIIVQVREDFGAAWDGVSPVGVDSSLLVRAVRRLRFEVRDTGIGIPQDRLAVVFAPFEQADSSTARRYGGTGLGLTISERLVQLLGGTLTAESEPGRGSTFAFTIPLTQPQRSVLQPPKKRIEPAAPATNLRVLLAEDNLISQRITAATLEKRSFRVQVVANGKAAVAAWEAEPFDVILMDVQMPEMDGLEATAEIRRREQGTGRRIPIVALTAHVMIGEIDRCIAAGMDACITKPFSPDALCATIAEFTTEAAAAK